MIETTFQHMSAMKKYFEVFSYGFGYDILFLCWPTGFSDQYLLLLTFAQFALEARQPACLKLFVSRLHPAATKTAGIAGNWTGATSQ